MAKNEWKSRTKHDLTIEVWEALDCESVGARELEQIQQVIRDRFGQGAVESPAAIARTLADEGAVLRHPEVLDCDTNWREHRFEGIPKQLSFANLADASESIKKLDSLRRRFEQDSDQVGLSRLREAALRFKHDAQVMTQARVTEQGVRIEAKEIVQWLTVWLQKPDIFEDWLSLRQRSPEYRKLFQP